MSEQSILSDEDTFELLCSTYWNLAFMDGDCQEMKSEDQRCNFCLNPESILTEKTCCTGCSKLKNMTKKEMSENMKNLV